jgi:hypothetical protein
MRDTFEVGVDCLLSFRCPVSPRSPRSAQSCTIRLEAYIGLAHWTASTSAGGRCLVACDHVRVPRGLGDPRSGVAVGRSGGRQRIGLDHCGVRHHWPGHIAPDVAGSARQIVSRGNTTRRDARSPQAAATW